jgi:hypothetical protein
MGELLLADGPTPEYADKMMLFGQFVGAWEFDSIAYRTDDSEQRASGEWHFGWVLEGRAVQDVWVFPARADRGARPEGFDGSGEYGEYGSTVRFYDPKMDKWKVVWIGPVYSNLRTFEAIAAADGIIMTSYLESGIELRWSFSDITPNSFHWKSEQWDEWAGKWRLTEEMFLRRKS